MATKAKRKLSDIKFEKSGAHVALTSAEQGGPANGHDYALVMKSASPEFVTKMQQIQVTMDVPDFLEKFFHMYYSDAQVLARLMGYVPEESDSDDVYDPNKWIEERLEAFAVVKSLNESGTELKKSLAGLNEQDALAVRELQSKFELAVAQQDSAKVDEGSTEAVAKAKESGDKTNAKVEPSGNNSGNNMDEELVEKSTLVSVQKTLDETQSELQKALESIAALKAEKEAEVTKSKVASLKAIVTNEKQLEAISKAALTLDGEDFTAFTSALSEIVKAAEVSDLFKENGVTSAEEKVDDKESPVAKAVKAQLAKK